MTRRDPNAFLARLWRLEAALVEAGLPPMPPWWRETITGFYLSGKRRLVVRKGRRVFASTCVAPRLAVAEMLFGQHQHHPGTPPLSYVFLSVKRSEAAKRLRGVTAILDHLGEAYAVRGESIELSTKPAIFSVMTANFRTNVGDTLAFTWCDEVSRWRDDATMANPAEEVIGSLSPALATLPDAPLFLISSPLGSEDYHAKAYELGDTDVQCTAFGETWTINPEISLEQSKALEPDERLWRREYAAIPMPAGGSPFFSEDEITFATDVGRCSPAEPVNGIRYVVAADQAINRDRFGFAVVSHEVGPISEHGERLPSVVIAHEVGSWKPEGKPSVDAQRLAQIAHRYDQRRILLDQGAGGAVFGELLRNFNAYASVIAWTGGEAEDSKLDRFRRVRTAMAQGILRLPDRRELRGELRRFHSDVTSAGNERVSARRTDGGHSDAATALVLAASEALSQSACLPPEREMPWERYERDQAQANLGAIFGAYSGPEDYFPEIFGGNDI